MTWANATHVGDCRQLLRAMAADGVQVQTCVTSPPYYGLRDYGHAGQIGLEANLADWLAALVEVFDCVRDVLADDGTLWVNLGDAYCSDGGGGWQGKTGQRADRRLRSSRESPGIRAVNSRPPGGLKVKDLMGQPWRLAFALQDAGWYLRRDVIWHKPAPMPESAKDRPTTAHEYLFLLAKSERYFYNRHAIAEPVSGTAHPRGKGVNPKAVAGWAEGPGSHSTLEHATARSGGRKLGGKRARQNESWSAAVTGLVTTRNARSVWTMASEPTSFAHFATFPRALPRRCIQATSRPGDVVLDPFMGSGTTAQVAAELGRQWIGCELNAEYVEIQRRHRPAQVGMGL